MQLGLGTSLITKTRVLISMSQPRDLSEVFPRPSSRFSTTHWSLVLTARDVASPASGEAMERLCRAYWYPLYAYVRRQEHASHDAQDLTQEFFSRVLEKGYLHAAASEKGRFRTFLLVALQRFLANEWDRAADKNGDRQKRGHSAEKRGRGNNR
jgi:RNA polymerase sigma-70 factor (ECF subfamily)